MPDTLGSMRAEVVRWLNGESVDDMQINDAINDSIESLWQDAILALLSIFTTGPVEVPLSAGDEGRILISISDPTSSPTIGDVAAGDPALAAHTVRAAYSYVTESGSETMASPESSHTTAVGRVAAVQPPPFQSGAIGWNCYASSSPTGNLLLQNDQPVGFNVAFEEPSDLGFTADADDPQEPVENTTGDNIAYIRHLEFKTSFGGYKSYNAGDLDSDFMRRASTYIASTSEYQTYAWDLINQRQLEIRPAVGAAFTPRFFYVVKPRRLRFGNSPLPFPAVPQAEFIRTRSLSRIFLSLHEYDAHTYWEGLSDKALMKCVRALTQMGSNRNDRITPYMY